MQLANIEINIWLVNKASSSSLLPRSAWVSILISRYACARSLNSQCLVRLVYVTTRRLGTSRLSTMGALCHFYTAIISAPCVLPHRGEWFHHSYRHFHKCVGRGRQTLRAHPFWREKAHWHRVSPEPPEEEIPEAVFEIGPVR